jgi:MFS family permease
LSPRKGRPTLNFQRFTYFTIPDKESPMTGTAAHADPLRSETTGSLMFVVLVTLVAALGGLLFGYDTAVISGAIGFLEQHFGLDPQVETGWAAASALAGCAVGAALAGFLSDRIGRKKVLVVAAVCFFISAVGTALPRTFLEFVLFRIVGGIGIGAASITSPLYIAEISPAAIRGRMVSVNQFAIVSGMVLVYFVNYAIEGYGTSADQRTLAAEAAQAVNPKLLSGYLVAQSGRIEAESKRPAYEEAAALAANRPAQHVGDSAVDLMKAHGIKPRVTEAVEIELLARGLSVWNVQRGWRWMFGSGALPAALLLVLLVWVPESPRYLVQSGRVDTAASILARVSGSRQAEIEMADIQRTIAQESGSLGQLFLPGMRVVLLIGVALAVLQQLTGIKVLLYFAPEIFKSMGARVDVALLQTVLVGLVNFAFTVVAIWTVDRIGRKPLLLIGAAGMSICWLATGAASYCHQTNLWMLVFILGCIASFALSVGPVTWVVLSEIFPTRIRGRAMAVATVCLWAVNFVVTQTFTMMDKSDWLIARFNRAFPSWVYAALCIMHVLFVWRMVPETKGKTLEEIERSWGH